MEMTNQELAAILDRGRNGYGQALAGAVRARIRALIDDPCERTWGDAHGIIVFHDVTLWQAIVGVDPTFPVVGGATDADGKAVRGWPRIPDAELVLRALRFATH